MKKIPNIVAVIFNIIILLFSTFGIVVVLENNYSIEMDIKSTHTEKVTLSSSFFNTRSLDRWLEGKWEVDELRYDAAVYFSKWSSWTLGILLLYNFSFFAKRIMSRRKKSDTHIEKGLT